MSWMCKRQKTSVSHNSIESKVTSLVVGLRMDGLFALDLWDVVIEKCYVHRTTGNHQPREQLETACTCFDTKLTKKGHVPTNTHSSERESQSYVSENNEAMIKMIIKGRSPTMRHVSRTHRVALDWLLDRINVEPMIQIKYVDTKNQLADLLTKGSFTRDDWNHLLCLFNSSHFSSAVCCDTMAKRSQQDSREERVTSQDPWKSVAGENRSGRPDKGTDLFEASHEPFSFKQKTECHVQESSGNQDRRRSCGSKTEADELGIMKPLERRVNIFCRFGCFKQPSESTVGSEFCFKRHKATGARQQPRPNNAFSRAATR